jgi:hypothetical protein
MGTRGHDWLAGMTDPQPAAKITVQLIGSAAIALENSSTILGLSKTDTVNRALIMYGYLTALQEGGGEVHVVETPGGPMRRMVEE